MSEVKVVPFVKSQHLAAVQNLWRHTVEFEAHRDARDAGGAGGGGSGGGDSAVFTEQQREVLLLRDFTDVQRSDFVGWVALLGVQQVLIGMMGALPLEPGVLYLRSALTHPQHRQHKPMQLLSGALFKWAYGNGISRFVWDIYVYNRASLARTEKSLEAARRQGKSFGRIVGQLGTSGGTCQVFASELAGQKAQGKAAARAVAGAGGGDAEEEKQEAEQEDEEEDARIISLVAAKQEELYARL